MQKTIIETLIESKINFAIGISVSTFKLKGIDENSKDCFAMIFKNDLKHFKGFGFKPLPKHPGIYSHDLDDGNYYIFKQHMNLFKKVQHDADGRIYELKSKSFKKEYKQLYEK